nr:TraR/DksA C4-type zinc finger protein [uncultured Desulfobacter sp.]
MPGKIPSKKNEAKIPFLDTPVQTYQAMNLGFLTREGRLIKKVRLAMDRIKNGTCGEGEICGELISLERLEARPVTIKCISCKETEEREEILSQFACLLPKKSIEL